MVYLRAVWNLVVVHPRELVDVVAVQTADRHEGHHFGWSVLAVINRTSRHETSKSQPATESSEKHGFTLATTEE